MTETLKNKVRQEKQNDRLWRAKEILQGAIASCPYDEELYFEYAKVLFELGDYLESGKYFLLTNTDEKEHHEAIGLFLSRHHNETCFFQFPRQFKKVELENYPKNLQNLLKKNNFFKTHIISEQKYYEKRTEQTDDHVSKKEKFVIALLFGFLWLIFFIGFITSIKFLWSLL